MKANKNQEILKPGKYPLHMSTFTIGDYELFIRNSYGSKDVKVVREKHGKQWTRCWEHITRLFPTKGNGFYGDELVGSKKKKKFIAINSGEVEIRDI